MKFINHGQKVKYLHEGKWKDGIVHGIKTHETPGGLITRVAYLIDTGKTVHEGIGIEPTGKIIKNPITGEPTPEVKQVKVRQPEQIELDQELVKLA